MLIPSWHLPSKAHANYGLEVKSTWLTLALHIRSQPPTILPLVFPPLPYLSRSLHLSLSLSLTCPLCHWSYAASNFKAKGLKECLINETISNYSEWFPIFFLMFHEKKEKIRLVVCNGIDKLPQYCSWVEGPISRIVFCLHSIKAGLRLDWWELN